MAAARAGPIDNDADRSNARLRESVLDNPRLQALGLGEHPGRAQFAPPSVPTARVPTWVAGPACIAAVAEADIAALAAAAEDRFVEDIGADTAADNLAELAGRKVSP